MLANMDLHIHSKYSTAVSRDMELPEIAREAARKGVKIVGTGDCLFPAWLEAIKALPESDGLFSCGETLFALSVEVEDSHRVHHLIFLPDTSKAEELRDVFAQKSSNLDTDGRPRLHMNGAEVADAVLEAGGMIGPSHAFTPWTGIFAYYRSLQDCYQEKAKDIRFIELGLSADTDYADRIADLSSRTFLSNSDAHSPRANKLAREFNQMELQNMSYQDLSLAIRRESGRRPTLNVGFYPAEGKYNRTACTRCFRQYTATQKDELMGRCSECRGQIKLGVRDRVDSLADYPAPVHPDHRPPYLHRITLAEIISMALGYKSAMAASVQRVWNELTADRTEIQILTETDPAELKAETRIIDAIKAFRSGGVVVVPGGGGKYGEVRLPGTVALDEKKDAQVVRKQKSLFDF
ncbi:MAG: endonuclease Q family protein [Methanothrix sp.]|nr:MAG: endonuclease Q family protein [Methanothrix sp.]